MEIDFIKNKKEITSRAFNAVRKILSVPKEIRNDEEERSEVRFSLCEVKTENRVSGRIMLLIEGFRQDAPVQGIDPLNHFAPRKYKNNASLMIANSLTIVEDKITYRVYVRGLQPDENIAVGAIVMAEAFKTNPHHILELARDSKKRKIPPTLINKKHHLYKILQEA